MLGSLFDGLGGFPLAAIRNGITPVWASEIETAPIAITKKHFPDMKHLGDITRINGAEIEPVDIITFGSPCQDLSVAGKRAGLEGGRSGLFAEAVRIIKEMRNATNGIRPRFTVWENVTGAFSSNEGEDFRTVLQEIAKVAGGGAVFIPRPSSREGWLPAGAVVGDGWSLAWRVLDAQYWGVPQRRKRIFLIADFRGGCAGEILFKPDGLQGNTAESETKGEGVASNATEGVRITDANEVESIGVDGYNQNLTGEKSQTLKGSRVDASNIPLVAQAAGFNGWRSKTGTIEYEEERAPCLQANMPPNVCEQYAVDFGRTADRIQMNADKAVTLLGEGGGCGAKTGLYCLPIAISSKQQSLVTSEDVANTLGSNDYKEAQAVAYCIQGNTIERSDEAGANGKGVNEEVAFTLNTTDRHAVAYDRRNHTVNEEISGTLQAKENGGQSLNYINPIAVHQNQCGEVRQGQVANTLNTNGNASDRNAPLVATIQGFGDYKVSEKSSTIKSKYTNDNSDLAISREYIVRRLTPTECERLQGFPDGWTEYGVKPEKYKKSLERGMKRTGLPQDVLLSKISDSQRYKTLGNSVAIPCVEYIMRNIAERARK